MELYFHIPFCVRKCAYCAFDSFPGCSRQEMERYVAALIREVTEQQRLITEPIETVYIGGGTPSLLPPDLLKHLVTETGALADLSSVTEFTAEANPGTITDDWLHTAVSCGVNRISFGVQAVQDSLLRTLGRIHGFGEAIDSVKAARQFGLDNISVDLIFGIPGQSMDDWKQTIRSVLQLAPNHISAYGLIPEEGTPLFRDLESGKLSLPDPDLERDMYDTAIHLLSCAGYRQYEISNFALPGCECRHNIGYWDQIPYLGFGLSAASMVRTADPVTSCFSRRWTNPSAFREYLELTEHPAQREALVENISPEEARFETVMLSLRMTSGIKRSRFRELHGADPEYWYHDVLEKLRTRDLLKFEDDSWRLTRRGMDIQNSVLLEFMDQHA